jgi:hypothetical protein
MESKPGTARITSKNVHVATGRSAAAFKLISLLQRFGVAACTAASWLALSAHLDRTRLLGRTCSKDNYMYHEGLVSSMFKLQACVGDALGVIFW